jgi:hypothetical protein
MHLSVTLSMQVSSLYSADYFYLFDNNLCDLMSQLHLTGMLPVLPHLLSFVVSLVAYLIPIRKEMHHRLPAQPHTEPSEQTPMPVGRGRVTVVVVGKVAGGKDTKESAFLVTFCFL